MSDAVQVTFRPIYQEDLATSPTSGKVSDTVLGVGTVSLTPWVSAATDAAAASAGVGLGYVYFNTTGNALKTRMS